jgi:hypothetical protein
MPKKSRPRFHVRSDRRVYDGSTYLCTADTDGKATRIVAALVLADINQPKDQPTPLTDGLPAVPDGFVRMVIDAPKNVRYRSVGYGNGSARVVLTGPNGAAAVYARRVFARTEDSAVVRNNVLLDTLNNSLLTDWPR